MAVAAKVLDVQIHVHHQGHAMMDFGAGNQRIDLLYGGGNGDTTGTHYDVLILREREDTKEIQPGVTKTCGL